jgi:hypothetical protein
MGKRKKSLGEGEPLEQTLRREGAAQLKRGERRKRRPLVKVKDGDAERFRRGRAQKAQPTKRARSARRGG